jgi:hypothetical protein
MKFTFSLQFSENNTPTAGGARHVQAGAYTDNKHSKYIKNSVRYCLQGNMYKPHGVAGF